MGLISLILAGIAAVSPVDNARVNDYIVKTANPEVLQTFVAENSLSIKPLISYSNPSEEVLDRFGDIYIVDFSQNSSNDSLINVLPTLNGVIYVEQDRECEVEPVTEQSLLNSPIPDTSFSNPYIPNDPKFEDQWDKKEMNADWAWNLSTGYNVPVAILDVGVNTKHEDLKGIINFDMSYNFYEDNKNIESGSNETHGTPVAGIVASEIDNEKGLAGVAGKCDLWILKVDDPEDGAVSTSAEIEALAYCGDKGARVISMSYGFNLPFQTEENVINYCWEKGIFMTASVGNRGQENKPNYPSMYEHVMGVGAVDSDLQRVSSNYGSSVDIFAPGEGVLTTTLSGRYNLGWGTSFAAPQVAGLGALLFEEHPTWTPQQVWDKIIESSRTITLDIGDVKFPDAAKMLDIQTGITEQPTILVYQLDYNMALQSLQYSLPANSQARLDVFDVSGRLADRGYISGQGSYSTGDLGSGVFFYQIQVNGQNYSGKFVNADSR